MIVKVYGENKFTYINYSTYVNHTHYYEELLKIKFNKSIKTINIVEELKEKINKYIKNKV
jgi:hypothetical protein